MTIQSLRPQTSLVSSDAYRRTASRLPTAVAVVTAQTPDGPSGCTISAVMSLSVSPPAMAVSLTTGSRTLAHVLDDGRFAVNVLPWTARALVQQFATGTPAQRFAEVDWRTEHGAPVLSVAPVVVVCEVAQCTPLLDHTLVAGTVLWMHAEEEPGMVLFGGTPYAVGR
ncbi:flavin reductase family protein [Streptomyces sp. TRM 70361]|uniref:flavin reductase family protein n=1 Tax=Streptomyces sp. TRM 70361 TaxID=3116553 RepID=UPI002E7BF149|nr:flavin reductase family protein [Streptomyces sp. TRM 70361]MEE1943041.1 flavin reductase family protein [Streptomyces sp. TRM 70361]